MVEGRHTEDPPPLPGPLAGVLEPAGLEDDRERLSYEDRTHDDQQELTLD
jgi:hypothetical protein